MFLEVRIGGRGSGEENRRDRAGEVEGGRSVTDTHGIMGHVWNEPEMKEKPQKSTRATLPKTLDNGNIDPELAIYCNQEMPPLEGLARQHSHKIPPTISKANKCAGEKVAQRL